MPNNLPLNWCECKFGDVGYLQNGYAFNSKLYKEKGVNLIRISDIQDNEVILDNCVKVSEKVDECFQVHKGDFLLAMSGATTGKTGIYNSEDEALLNQRVGNLKIYNEKVLLPKFRNYFISNKRSLIEKLAYGGAQPNISKAMIEDLDILLPPLAEQERIVAKIEALFQDIDDGVERLKSAQAQIKQYRQSVLKSAFEQCKHKGTINDIAQLTKIGPFGSLLHKSDYVKNGIPLVNPSHIKNLTILPNKDICVLPSKLKQLQSYVLKKYDIVIGRRGEMGRCAVVDEQQEGWLCGTGSMFLRLKKENYPYFYALYIASQQCIQYLERNAMGTTMKNLNEKIIKKVPIPLPTLPEQQRIVEEIEKRFAVADVLEKAVNAGLEKADKLKQSILKKAFEGKLVPQNPNDEPASVLLERIKKSQKPTKGKKK